MEKVFFCVKSTEKDGIEKIEFIEYNTALNISTQIQQNPTQQNQLIRILVYKTESKVSGCLLSAANNFKHGSIFH
jgi:hypothetical protein